MPSAEPFASRVRAGLARRMAELEHLAVEMFARRLHVGHWSGVP